MNCCHNTGTDRQNFKILGFKLLNNFKLFSRFNEVQTYSLMIIC